MRVGERSGLAFSVWLVRQGARGDAIGTLARSARRDRGFRPTTRVEDLRYRMIEAEAGEVAHRALDQAAREWSRVAHSSAGMADARERDPRAALAAAAERRRVSLAGLSLMLGRGEGYLARFVREGIPLALSRRDHGVLADFFGVDERGMGIRDLWADA